MPQFEYVIPSDIDGPPGHVANRARDQLAELGPWVADLATDSYVQIRSSWMSSALDAAPDLTPTQVAEKWTNSRLEARIGRVLSAAAELRDAIEALQTGPKG